MQTLLSEFVVAFLCLVLSAYFSATETAVTGLSTLRAKHLKDLHGKRGKVLDLWLHAPQRLLVSILIGHTLVNVFGSLYAYTIVERRLGGTSVELIAVVFSLTIVVFAHVIPKILARRHAARIVIPALAAFRVFYFLFYPLAYLLSSLIDRLAAATRWDDEKALPQITKEEIEYLIDVGEQEGVIAEQKREMLSSIFQLGDTVVREIMVHRADMHAVETDRPVQAVADVFRETGLSRLPVYKDSIDNILGVVHAKEVLFFVKQHENHGVAWRTPVLALVDTRRDALFVPETKPVDELFQELRRTRAHFAVVLDEYGSTSGLVTMEDILEEIVGEIRDEFDREEDAIRPTPKLNQFLVDARIHIEDFLQFFEVGSEDFDVGDGEFDTLGGFAFHRFGRFPKPGETLIIGHLEVEVLEVSKRRVRRVIVRVRSERDAVGETAVEGGLEASVTH